MAYLYSTIEALAWQPKDLLPMPALLALALQADGWIVRRDVIWAKRNCMPESATDRCTSAHEFVFHLAKRPRYWYDGDAIREAHSVATVDRWDGSTPSREPGQWTLGEKANRNGKPTRPFDPSNTNPAGRNARSVWEIATQPTPEAHFATYPEELVRRCLLAGCPLEVCRTCGRPRERIVESLGPDKPNEHDRHVPGGQVRQNGPAKAQMGSTWSRRELGWSDCGHRDYRRGICLDPFIGSGTTARVARNHSRHAVGIDLSAEYLAIAAKRLQQLSLLGGIA